MGWNLPPGVTVNDLPGNSIEDIRAELAAEQLSEQVYESLPDYMSEADQADLLQRLVNVLTKHSDPLDYRATEACRLIDEWVETIVERRG